MSATEQRVQCAVCSGLIELLDDGASRWWVHDVHPKDGHDAIPRAALTEITEQRRRDIRARMQIDLDKALGRVLRQEDLDHLTDEAMFYVEHLLAEIEGLVDAESPHHRMQREGW